MVLEVSLIIIYSVRYSHCSNRCWDPVHCISFARLENILFNQVSIVIVLVKNMFKVFVFVHVSCSVCPDNDTKGVILYLV